jgi:hypothetical protein
MGLNMAEFISIVAHIALARSVLERCVFFLRPSLFPYIVSDTTHDTQAGL